MRTTTPEPAGDFTPQDLVLTLVGAHLDRRNRRFWSGGLVTLLGEFGFSPGAARIALARLANRGLLDRYPQGRYVNYALSGHAQAVLAEGDRRIFSFGRTVEPVATWTVVWQTVPEERRQARERLVRRLRFAGFGTLQDGTWITPHDREREVAALVAELDVAEHVGVLLGRPSVAVDFHAVVDRAWDLSGLSTRYQAFLVEFAPYTDPAARAALDDRTALVVRTRLVHQFRKFPTLDPELPADLADPPIGRVDAVAMFHDLYPTLAEAARRHFDSVT